MNNALILEEEEPKNEKAQEYETELVRVVEAIAEVLKTKEWQVLKGLVFDKEVERVERLLTSEARKVPLSIESIYRLQGELKWAKRYSDLKELAQHYQNQLKGLRTQ